MILDRSNMKRHFLEETDREILSFGSFSKRLKLDDGYPLASIDPLIYRYGGKDNERPLGRNVSHVSDGDLQLTDDHSIVNHSDPATVQEICESVEKHVGEVECGGNDKLLGTSEEPSEEPSFDANFAAVNPILRELHQQREGRKSSKKNSLRHVKHSPSPPVKHSPSNSDSSNTPMTPHPSPPGAPSPDRYSYEPSDIWSHNCTTQRKFRLDYESRVNMEFDSGIRGSQNQSQRGPDRKEPPSDVEKMTSFTFRDKKYPDPQSIVFSPVSKFASQYTASNTNDDDEMEID